MLLWVKFLSCGQKGNFLTNQRSQKIPKYFPVQCSPMKDRALFCLKVVRLRPLVLLITVVLRWKWVWRIHGMILTEENRRTLTKACPSATLSTTNVTRTCLGSKAELQTESPETKLSEPRHGPSANTDLSRIIFNTSQKTLRFHYKDQ